MNMKHIKRFTTAALLALSLGAAAQTDHGIDRILRGIETNNKELQANAQLIASQKLTARSDNNLADPTLSYAHLWGNKDKNNTIGELVVSQAFDFPTLYASRAQLNRLRSTAFDGQQKRMRQDILLQAKELCLDIIWLKQQKEVLSERRSNAEELSKVYARRLATGDANRLETNKINLELLNVKTEAAMNETALRNKLEALTALNGNQPLAVELATYPSVTLPADYEALRREALATDPTLQTLASESLVARKQVAVNKQNWLPQLELGYRRNTESGEPFNGVVVGFSFPLFQNRNKVKAARAQSLNIDLLKENTATQVSSELTQAYTEAKSLYASMEEYRKTFESQQDLSLLKQALAGGQINMIEYFVELSVVYQSRQNYLLLENQYQKAVARIYKGLL